MADRGEGSVGVAREARPAGPIARVTVDRPARLNVLGSPLIAELTAAFEDLAGQSGLRAVVLTGAGSRAFIGGADVREMAELTPKSARAFIAGLHRLCAAIQALPLPVVARIRGYCLGAGLEVAAACDLRVASDDARFGMPEVRLGIPSVIEAALLPRLIGLGRARELLLTGETLGAARAIEIGLIERLAPAAQLDAAVDERLDALLAAGPRALAAQKALLREWQELPLSEAIERSIEAFAAAFEDGEPRRRMRAFLARKR